MNVDGLKIELRKAEEISRDLIILENELLKTNVEEEKEMLRNSYSSLLEKLKQINDSLPDLISAKEPKDKI